MNGNRDAGSAAGPIDHDPHPANEVHPYRFKSHPEPRRKEDISPNNATYNGRPQKRPSNAETE